MNHSGTPVLIILGLLASCAAGVELARWVDDRPPQVCVEYEQRCVRYGPADAGEIP